MLPKDELCDRILMSLRRITRAIDVHSRKLMQEYHLTGPQLVLLREIMRQAEIPIGDLAKRANLSNATITGIVDRLEARGLVRRVRGAKDRRQVFIQGTPVAQDLLQHAPPPLQERFVQALEELHQWEQAQILASLDRVACMMDAEAFNASPFLSNQPLQPSRPAARAPMSKAE